MSILDFDALSLLFDHYMSTDRSLLGTLPPSRPENGAPFGFARHTNTDDEPLKTHEPTQQYARTVYARTVGDTDFSLKSSDSHPMDPDLSLDPKYQCTENERLLLRDIERHKVFVDIEDFMHSVLLIPKDWRIEYGSLVEYVRNDRGFITSLRKYLRFCGRGNIADVDLRPGFLIPAAQLLASRSENDRFIPRTNPLDDSKWAQLLKAGEREHLNCTLVDGRSGKRIKDRHGNDPAEAHRKPGRKRYYSRHHKIPIHQRKRKAEEEIHRDAKRQKVQSAPVEQTLVSVWSMRVPPIVLPETEDNGYSDPSKSKENAQATMLQVVRYLVEKFSASALRSHVTAGLVDRDRIQLFHANHSVLLISRAISLKENEDLDMFIAILIGIHKMTLHQLGVVDKHREFLSDNNYNGERPGEGVEQSHKKRHDDNSMTLLQKVPGKKPIVIDLDGVLNRETSIIGRSTSTLYGTSAEWPGVNLVIKISFPSAGRVSEETFLNAATDKAKEFAKDGERYWVLDHLPRLLHAETVELDEVEENIKELCTTREYVGGKKSSYDERRRRILVYEMLNPLETLTTAKDVAQVFVDILATHKWLYDHPRILHRDISMDNVMYRIGADGTIYGVLNDFDLSSFRDAIETSTSVQRTGTPPFMAMDVLEDLQYHYYRHDLESIFYVMLVIASRYELQLPSCIVTNPPFLPRHIVLQARGQLPLAEWFDCEYTYEALASHKAAFLKDGQIPLTGSFECLRPWLTDMLLALNEGLSAQYAHQNKVTRYERSKATHPGAAEEEEMLFPDELCPPVRPTVLPPPPFNDRTLDDHVTFKIFVRPAVRVVRGLGSKLRFRYNGPEFVAGD